MLIVATKLHIYQHSRRITTLLKAIIYISLFLYSFALHSQSISKKLLNHWVKVSVENLSPVPTAPDTLYTRYSFNRETVNISFYPAWNDFPFQWSLAGQNLTIGYETYLLEELTDTTLIFSKEGFRRFRFVSERLYSKSKNPDTTLPINGQTVYIASNYLTPRYKKEKPLNSVIQDLLGEKYSIKHKTTFIAKFIITVQGKVERIQIITGISTDFDNDFIKLIKKTSGDWYPAKIDDNPVNCEMSYLIKYLNALNPNMGILKGNSY